MESVMKYPMNPQHVSGISFAAVGLLLFIVGALSAHVLNARFVHGIGWYLFSGIVAMLVGLALMFFRPRGTHA
jgi:VIT1/CCC1 family predicted Fe2+/Mn2+ transporter